MNHQYCRIFNRLMVASAFWAAFGIMASAQDTAKCDLKICLKDQLDTKTVVSISAGENTEREADADRIAVGSKGFSISVDGERIAGSKTISDTQRTTDVGLEEVDIQIKFDGLDVQPVLNISTDDAGRIYRAGDAVMFRTNSNYSAWIERAEVRIFKREALEKGVPEAVLTVAPNGSTSWTMPQNGDKDLSYVLRVYDSQNRYDETVPLSLSRTSSAIEPHQETGYNSAPGEGDDRTARRNIPVYGGAVTVFGRNVPPGYRVRAIGETIAVDANKSFVVQRILPPGDHDIGVAIEGIKDTGLAFERKINIPGNDWFYVALADITIGKRFGTARLIAADQAEYDKVYTKGRLAFYLKGKIQGKYLLTAAADTGEDKLGNIFKNLDSKDPRQFLGRIDPDDFYAVYGDDSTSREDAPTRGKFYVRLERGDSHVMWGNFKARVNGAELVRNERALYGASGVYRSEQTTSFGERKFEANIYAAQAETLPQRDVLRGTGGSAYFLKRQDLVSGSETVTVEVRSDTGRVLSRKALVAGVDYDIDPIQGVIILRQPLGSTTTADSIVRDGTLGGDAVNLIVQYEYTPSTGEVDGLSYGARVQGWPSDKVRLGVTALREEAGTADQRLAGADVTIRHSETTYLKAEIAQSEGPGFGRSKTTDGGLAIHDDATAGLRDKEARAYTMRGQLDLADISGGKTKGTLGAFYEHKDGGFSSLDEDINVGQTIRGFDVRIKANEKTTINAIYEDFKDASGKSRKEGGADVAYEINEYWKASIGVKYVGLRTSGGLTSGLPKENGNRTDVGVRLAYTPDDNRSIYAFGQATAGRSGGLDRNDRIGVGGKAKLTEKIGLTGEVSYGTSGAGALAALSYDPTVDDHYYIGYALEPDKRGTTNTLEGTDLGGIVIGAKRRYNDVLSAYTENNYDLFGKRHTLTSAYGVIYTPDSVWTTSAGFETGTIKDPNDSDFDRKAFSLSIGYKDDERITARIRGEVRFENSEDNTRDRQTYLGAATLSWKTNDDWRFIANIDAVLSTSDALTTTILDGDYIEASVGYAYRPVNNDRFNLLAKYTYLYDLPGPDQVNANGNKLGPAQRSHIFSIDGSYDVTQVLTLGAKYGMRIGQVSSTRAAKDFANSSVHLGILRADVHVVHNWDAAVEGRVLHSSSARTTNYGALAAVYRHFGENVKVGLGYNFGRFSGEISDLTLDDQGLFLNVIGKF
jgi:hypothetical protein